MTNTVKIALIAVIAVIILIIVIILIKNSRNDALKKELSELYVRYNAIKTIPLAFKLNKAQAMAKRNADTSDEVQGYYNRYSDVQAHIDDIGEMLEEVEDALAGRNSKHAKEIIESLKTEISSCENEVTSIDEFLEQFSMKENEQRDISARLKEDYREVKMNINQAANLFSIAYEGVCKKLERIEDLFSQSEEWMFANDYERAKSILAEITERIKDIKICYELIPDLVKDAKGVIPVLQDEVSRQYSLGRQRGMYLDHLNIDERLANSQKTLNAMIKVLMDGDQDNVKETLDNLKNELSGLLKNLEQESQDFADAKTIFDNISSNIKTIKDLYTYVDATYVNENERFDMDEIGDFLKQTKMNIDGYAADVIRLSGDLSSNIRPSSVVKGELEELFNKTENDLERLSEYKHGIDKNSNDEERAKTQLVKLQVVLNEVEVKVLEYHLPTIAANYHEDLLIGREKIANIKKLLEEVPLDIDKLNTTLDEAIEFIYTFYNNVNNIVGMAIMVENAIVFGNKYRSTYNTVDRDLSKAEFSYLNGEYTKALTMAISCMETLFPNNANEKILENN